MVGQASEEVQRLQATILDLDRCLGWEAAAEAHRCDPLDVHGAVAWQPAGKQRAAARRPASASPARAGGGGGSPGGAAMSPLSRRIMEEAAASGSPGGGSFLDRLGRDLEARAAKKAAAARRAGRYQPGSAEAAAAEREREAADLRLLRWGCWGVCPPAGLGLGHQVEDTARLSGCRLLSQVRCCHWHPPSAPVNPREVVEARDDELAAALTCGEAGRVAQACDDLADAYQQARAGA